jgi:hypothetical protein
LKPLPHLPDQNRPRTPVPALRKDTFLRQPNCLSHFGVQSNKKERFTSRGAFHFANRAQPGRINFGCDRALEQSNGHNDPVSLLDFVQDALETLKGTVLDLDLLAHLEVRKRTRKRPRVEEHSKALNFNIRDIRQGTSNAKEAQDPRGPKDLDAPARITPAKEVTGEQGHLKLLHPIAPPAKPRRHRKKGFIVQRLQRAMDCIFKIRLDPDREPLNTALTRTHFNLQNGHGWTIAEV